MELTELESRILSELDEAGEEDALAILNTVINPKGSLDEIANYQQALRLLLDKKLIELDLESMPTGPISLSSSEVSAEIDALSKNFAFVSEGKHWTDIREKGPPYFQTPLPRLVITDMGDALAFKILDARGYQWWRNKD